MGTFVGASKLLCQQEGSARAIFLRRRAQSQRMSFSINYQPGSAAQKPFAVGAGAVSADLVARPTPAHAVWKIEHGKG